jgi:Holliday junction DNA helicase RuvB
VKRRGCGDYVDRRDTGDGVEVDQMGSGVYVENGDVDHNGLDDMDNRILSTIIDKFKGGPVGINTISTACSEEAETIEEVYEPFLIQQGFIYRTPRGREVTELAYKHLGRVKGNIQGGLF